MYCTVYTGNRMLLLIYKIPQFFPEKYFLGFCFKDIHFSPPSESRNHEQACHEARAGLGDDLAKMEDDLQAARWGLLVLGYDLAWVGCSISVMFFLYVSSFYYQKESYNQYTIEVSFVTSTPPRGFICFVPNPRVLLANRVDYGLFFCFINLPILPHPDANLKTLPISKISWTRWRLNYPPPVPDDRQLRTP